MVQGTTYKLITWFNSLSEKEIKAAFPDCKPTVKMLESLPMYAKTNILLNNKPKLLN
jgi:hypothetical protein